MSDYKLSTVIGFIGVVVGLIAFLYNYNMTPALLPGYDVLLAPAMLLLSFFTEELPFTQKMILLLSGQFIGYFLFSILVIKLVLFIRWLRQS